MVQALPAGVIPGCARSLSHVRLPDSGAILSGRAFDWTPFALSISITLSMYLQLLN